jgi:membrane-bound inhibitor of C-type lysozyme
LPAVLVLGCAIWAQSAENVTADPATHTLTISIKGTTGPILSGSDPLNLDGRNGTIKILASESLSPTKHTASSATYSLPAGAVSLHTEKQTYTTTSPSKMTIKLSNKSDNLIVVFSLTSGGATVMFTDTSALAGGSWTTAVLKHPTVFAPSPQTLTSATTANGLGSKLKYVSSGSTTVLGFTGTASNSATADPVLPDDDMDQ